MSKRAETNTTPASRPEFKCEANNYFGLTLKELRMSRNMKQYEAAESLGCTPAQWSIYESGRTRPSFDSIMKICEFMSVSPIALLAKVLDKSKYAGTGLELSFDEYEACAMEGIEKLRRSKYEEQIRSLARLVAL